MAQTTTEALQALCRSASHKHGGALVPARLRWNVWNREQHPYPESNSNRQSQSNSNRYGGDSNTAYRDNGYANAGDDTDHATNALAL